MVPQPLERVLTALDALGEPAWRDLAHRIAGLVGLDGPLPMIEAFDLVEAGSAERHGVPLSPRCTEQEAAEALLSAWARLPARSRTDFLAGLDPDPDGDPLVQLFAAAEAETAQRTAMALLEGDLWNGGEAGERVPA